MSRPTSTAVTLVFVLAATAPASAVVVASAPGGFVVENAETVPPPPEAVWNALVNEVDRWWPRDHTWWEGSTLSIDPVAGGCFCEVAGDRQARHMEVAYVDPPRTLRMVGGLGPLQGMGLHGALEWKLEPIEGGGTRITLRYQVGGYSPDDLGAFAPVVDRVQAVQLGGLAELVRGAERDDDAKETPTMSTVRGPFEVTITPEAGEQHAGTKLGRSALVKTYRGALDGTATGTMLTAITPTSGSAGYVAIERFEGALEGRRGAFLLQHAGIMDRGAQSLDVVVVPDSGTGELAGITGRMGIEIAADGAHAYELSYALPDRE